MLKHLSICVALIAFGIGSASAQQREAILQKVEVPGAAFDLMLATPKTPAVIIDLSEFARCPRHSSCRRATRPRFRERGGHAESNRIPALAGGRLSDSA